MAAALLVATAVKFVSMMSPLSKRCLVAMSSLTKVDRATACEFATRCVWEGKVVLVLSLLDHFDGI